MYLRFESLIVIENKWFVLFHAGILLCFEDFKELLFCNKNWIFFF